jgi:hypothetical protein
METMKMRTILISLLAVSAVLLLLAGCQTKDEDPVESTFRSLLKIAADDAVDYDSFGMSLAMDGSYALVGAPGVDGSGENQGAAYLFLQTQGGADGWGQFRKLIPDDPADDDMFGISVDISGDYAVIGAGGADGGSTDEGAAYVFYRNQGGTDNWGQVVKLVAGDADDSDGFGFAVAIDGDTVIVGADGVDGGGTDEGAAYIFSRDYGGADAWGQVAKLVSDEPADSNQFGFAVGIGGGIAIVGSPGEAGEGTECGVVYIFSRDLGGTDAWGQAKAFAPGDTPDYTWLGTAVVTDGTRAVIGSPWDDGAGTPRARSTSSAGTRMGPGAGARSKSSPRATLRTRPFSATASTSTGIMSSSGPAGPRAAARNGGKPTSSARTRAGRTIGERPSA